MQMHAVVPVSPQPQRLAQCPSTDGERSRVEVAATSQLRKLCLVIVQSPQ